MHPKENPRWEKSKGNSRSEGKLTRKKKTGKASQVILKDELTDWKGLPSSTAVKGGAKNK